MSAAAERPVPVPTGTSRPYWEGARDGVLRIQRCPRCERHQAYPRPVCTHCGSRTLGWVDASGTGTVHTFTVARRATLPGFEALLPYVIALVDLAEGPRITTNLVGVDPADVHIGMAVEVCFEPLSDGQALPLFRPAA
jgi:uncharacterized OB-fold protein